MVLNCVVSNDFIIKFRMSRSEDLIKELFSLIEFCLELLMMVLIKLLGNLAIKSFLSNLVGNEISDFSLILHELKP